MPLNNKTCYIRSQQLAGGALPPRHVRGGHCKLTKYHIFVNKCYSFRKCYSQFYMETALTA